MKIIGYVQVSHSDVKDKRRLFFISDEDARRLLNERNLPFHIAQQDYYKMYEVSEDSLVIKKFNFFNVKYGQLTLLEPFGEPLTYEEFLTPIKK